MTGLEKMKNQILDEAKSLAEAKVSDAENQAQEILEARKQKRRRLPPASPKNQRRTWQIIRSVSHLLLICREEPESCLQNAGSDCGGSEQSL